jgi:gliding motility-associated-like protein
MASPLLNTSYTVEVTSAFGCKKSDSIALVVAQPFRLTGVRDTFVCAGSTVQLRAQGASSYRWISNTTGLSSSTIADPVVRTTADATYTVVGYDAVSCFTDTMRAVVAVKPLPTVSAGPDIEMLAAETRQVQGTASPDVVRWKWTPETYLSCTNCPAPFTSARTPMEYTVTVHNKFGCTATDMVAVKLQCSEEFVYIPNGFTPNGDGSNDRFYIKGKGIGIIKSLVIYSRWGQPVFERHNFNIDDVSAAWDGRFQGMPLPAGSYVYMAEMQCPNGQPIMKKGTVTLIR